eukprot:356946_1
MSGDAKYFQTTKKGEIRELQDDLNSVNKEKIKEAVKKVIAAMTVGKDVSMLFSDVIKSMGSYHDKLKKTVYLYVRNYADNKPEYAILVVGMFQKDATNNPNPLMRALSIRTMGFIKIDRITEYLCDPLNITLKDENWYVRKTAAICVAKLNDINNELVEERGFIHLLQTMLYDTKLNVVANAILALTDISQNLGTDVFTITDNILKHLLITLNESNIDYHFCTIKIISYWIRNIHSNYILCDDILSLILMFTIIEMDTSAECYFEWGTVYILEVLSQFYPNKEQANNICEKITPLLWNSNNIIVMSTIKCIIHFINICKNNKYYKRLEEPLIRLLLQP